MQATPPELQQVQTRLCRLTGNRYGAAPQKGPISMQNGCDLIENALNDTFTLNNEKESQDG
jgi:hypothetical protein